MADPTVSIIIPVYNRAHIVRRAIESVLCQDFGDLELLVIDDGSVDDLAGVLEQCADPRLRLLRHDVNRGAGAARNTGVRAARGSYVAFLDSDDEWLPGKLRRQLDAIIAAGPAVGGAVSGFTIDRGPGSDVQSIVPSPYEKLFVRLLWGCDLSPGATLICRRVCFDVVGYFDEGLRRLEDWDWLLRYAQKYELAIVRDVLSIVHNSGAAPSAQVAEALGTIAARYQPVADELGPEIGRIFRASLLLERAAIAFREQRRAAAIRLVLESLRVYPARNWRFFRRMTNHALSSIRWPFSRQPPASTGQAAVLHVITTLMTGGAENMLAQLATRDQAAGRRQWVAMLKDGGMNADRLAAVGVPVVPVHVNGPLDVVGGLIRLVRLIRRTRPDVIAGWMYHGNVLATVALYLSGRLYKTRLIWGLRNSDMDFGQYRPRLRVMVRLGAWLSRLPDAVIANSQAGFTFHTRIGYRPNRFYIIDNGVDPSRFTPDPAVRDEVRRELGIAAEACVAIIVARVDPMKDHPNFLTAIGQVGGGLVSLAAGRETEDLPDAPGFIKLGERRDVPRLLAASDILVLSSSFGEGVPNVVLEGMAAGLAIVATDVGDTQRVLGTAGMLVPPRDAAALAAALRRLRDDPALRRSYGAAARQRAETLFSIDHAVTAFRQIFDWRSEPAFRWSIIPLSVRPPCETQPAALELPATNGQSRTG